LEKSPVLLVVDVQRGFLNAWTEHVPAAVGRLQAGYDHVAVTRFQNPPGSPYRDLIGWSRFAPGSADTELAFAPRADAIVIDKSTYTCVDAAFLARLQEWNADTVDICGIATDNCVLKCAVDLFEAGIRPRVLSEYCASHGGPDCQEAGPMLLRRFIGEKQVA
jgi:nicotinamidase-related amidase